MLKIKYLLLFLSFTLSYSCTDKNSDDTEQKKSALDSSAIDLESLNGQSAVLVDSKDNLPECNESAYGKLFFVSNSQDFWVCLKPADSDNYGYQVIDIKGKDGVDGIAGSAGIDGMDGSKGDSGLNSFIKIETIAYGDENCPAGGSLFTTYLDKNSNLELDEGEAYNTPVTVCEFYERNRNPYYLSLDKAIYESETTLVVSGLASKWYRPDEKLTVQIYLDGDINLGTLVAEGLADQVYNEEFGSTGFSFTIELGADNGQHDVYAYVIINDQPQLIAGSPLSSIPDGPIESLAERITVDGVNLHVIKGYAKDTGAPSSKLTIKGYIDGDKDSGTLIGETIADRFQSSSVGNHAFQLAVGIDLLNNRSRQVHLYTVVDGVEHELYGSPLSFVAFKQNNAFPGTATLGISTGCGCHTPTDFTYDTLWPDLVTPITGVDPATPVSPTNNRGYELTQSGSVRAQNHPAGPQGSGAAYITWWCTEFNVDNNNIECI